METRQLWKEGKLMDANEIISDALKELHTAIQLAESAEQRKTILTHARRLIAVLVEKGSIPQDILDQWDNINV